MGSRHDTVAGRARYACDSRSPQRAHDEGSEERRRIRYSTQVWGRSGGYIADVRGHRDRDTGPRLREHECRSPDDIAGVANNAAERRLPHLEAEPVARAAAIVEVLLTKEGVLRLFAEERVVAEP
jgi:hypothetical protein